MSYQLKHLHKIEQLLGKETLEMLFCFVNDGTLVKDNLESMSYSHNMNVSETFTMCEEKRYLPSKILEKMLDDWYKKTLGKMSPADAKKRFHEILKKSCAPVIAGDLEKVMRKIEAGDGRDAGAGDAPAPGSQSAVHQNTTGDNNQPIMNWGTINFHNK